MPEAQLINLAGYETAATASLPADVADYFAGGAGDERTLAENAAALRRRHLRPRVLVDVSEVSAATTVLGSEVSMPILIAPTALHGLAHGDAEQGTARAAAAAGTIFCMSTAATTRPADVAASAPSAPRWLQLYWFRDRAVTRALVEEAVAAGFDAIVLTVDAPRAGQRERDLRNGFVVPASVDLPAVRAATGVPYGPTIVELFDLIDRSLDWSALSELAGYGLPVIVKGIQTAEDATLACEHGAAAVIVSNHGGRQLDGVGGSIDVLPEVVDAVADRLEVYVDGGIRRGTDVAVAIALGARAVLLGRPILWGLAVDGEAGVLRALELIRAEFELAMTLLGTPAVAAITREYVT